MALRTNILGIGYDNVTLEQAVHQSLERMRRSHFQYIVLPDDSAAVRACREPRFRDALNAADLVLARGTGIQHAAKILHQPLEATIRPEEYFLCLVSSLVREHKKLFLLGGPPGTAVQLGQKLKNSVSRLNLCGVQDEGFQEDARMAQIIRKSGADAVFVFLESPRQEYFMVEHGLETDAAVMIGMGQTIQDVIQAGEAPAKTRTAPLYTSLLVTKALESRIRSGGAGNPGKDDPQA